MQFYVWCIKRGSTVVLSPEGDVLALQEPKELYLVFHANGIRYEKDRK